MPRPKKVITEYRSYYLPLHFPVLLLSGDHWRISDKPSGRLHFHNCLEIGICHSDGGTLEFYGESCRFKEGDVTCIPRNVPHTTYSNPGTKSHWSYLFLDPELLFSRFLPAAWRNYDLSTYTFRNYKFILSKEEYPQIHSLVMLAVKELEKQDAGFELSAQGLLLSLYIKLYRIQHQEAQNNLNTDAPPMPDHAISITPALNYIENNYMQQLTMEQLADECHLSPTHFRRTFHEIMGMPPLEYLNITRIMKSCILLRSTQDTILNIAEQTGFQSISSFNRLFGRIMQMSPREYRKQMLQADAHNSNQSILEYSGWLFPERG